MTEAVQDLPRRNPVPRWRLAQIWDIVAVLILTPVVALMGTQLPGDWQIHSGSGLPGTATVVSVEPLRSGTYLVVDVADESGTTVARQQEVNGDSPHVLGATFPVQYLPPDDQGETQVYLRGHDPLTTNLWVFTSCLAIWAAALVRVGVRLWRLSRRWLAGNQGKRRGSCRAGHGYTAE
jgi:hypothetical protein